MTISIPWTIIVACVGVGLSLYFFNPFAGLQFSLAICLASDDLRVEDDEE